MIQFFSTQFICLKVRMEKSVLNQSQNHSAFLIKTLVDLDIDMLLLQVTNSFMVVLAIQMELQRYLSIKFLKPLNLHRCRIFAAMLNRILKVYTIMKDI